MNTAEEAARIPDEVIHAAKIADILARNIGQDGIDAAARVVAEWARREALREAAVALNPIRDVLRRMQAGSEEQYDLDLAEALAEAEAALVEGDGE